MIYILGKHDGGTITMMPISAYRAMRRAGQDRETARTIINRLMAGGYAWVAWAGYGVSGYYVEIEQID